jgi:cell division protein FtsB
MNIVEHLQRLDTLIIEHTKPPVTAILRHELSLATEQGEAYQASSDKQDQTLAAQAQKIDQLMKENQDLIAANAQLQAPHRRVGLVGGLPVSVPDYVPPGCDTGG